MSRHRACCSHTRSLRILLISLSLCLSLEASDACASPYFPQFRHLEVPRFLCGLFNVTLACVAFLAILATLLALAEFAFPPSSLSSTGRRLPSGDLRVYSRLLSSEDASALEVIFRLEQTIEVSQLSNVQLKMCPQ